ncbi:hypothetical protein CLOP_g15780 [Closterium sp. NIES-67]|nr:hypothetical protein CLOP_g15780 [Closterium sp. NIES-67]
MAHFAPCRTTITAKETERLFISTIVRLHGLPLAIINDRDPRFTSNFWQNLGILVRHPHAIFVRLPPTNRRSNRAHQSAHGAADTHQLPQSCTVGGIPAHVGIFRQQCSICNDKSLVIFPQLRDRPFYFAS